MKTIKRIFASLLCLVMLLTLFPVSVLAADNNVYTLSNGYISVNVSGKNGGFLVNTVEGNLLKKSDNNKKLLYHSDEYDTSFVSFRVGGKDYLFGGKYSGSSDVAVTQETPESDIVATWSVDGITFTQTISLAADNASEHGMVSVSLAAQNNSGAAQPIQARILLDTCLGDRDYAYYQLSGGGLTNTIQTEQIITDESSLRSFYAVDDIADPSVTAYVVSTPTKAAVGHWNNLAASLFDFTPDPAMNFTNGINDYLTADSACAMYYDLGSVANGATQSVVSYYGVYSNHTVSLENSVSINTVAPLRLELNAEKTAYVRQSGVGAADFAVTVSAENFESDTAKDLQNVILAVRSTGNLRSLSDSGTLMNGFDYDTTEPMTIAYSKMDVNETITKTLYFQAKPLDAASYERITIGMYKDEATTENLLGEKTVYLLLPGSDGNIPKVTFLSMTPSTIYNAGTRHLYVAVTNGTLLDDSLKAGNCILRAYSADGKTVRDIPAGNISVSDGIVDVALTDDEKTSLGSWYLQLEWSSDAVSKGVVASEFQLQTASVLNFTVSDDPKYKNDSYGVLAAVKYSKGSGSSQAYYYRLESFQDEEAFQKFSDDPDHTWKELLLIFRGEFTGDNRYPVKDENGKITGYRYYTAVSKKTVNETTRETTVDNCITINNCLDFEGGTMSVYYEDYANGSQDRAMESPILTEFEGDLYTSDARTSVWTGKAALTKLEQGGDFGLIHYTKDGVRKSEAANAVTLIWPNIYSYAQKLAGMAFKLAYGQFGVMEKDGKEVGRTIGFAASLSLSFMKSPAPEDDTAAPDTYFGRMQELWMDWKGASIYQFAYHGDRFNKLTKLDMNDSTDSHNNAKQGVQSSVMVKDILFGCGQGLVGLNFTVKVGVQNMIESLPKIEGTLSINTINDWSFGLEGKCKLSDNMKLEAKLKFKSYNDIPIPDDLYFYIGGFKPGVNIDGCGVVWITGGGGGFSNLYDTIFCSSGVPPLKLILTVSFSIIQILDATATIEVGLTGIDLTASNLKVMSTIEVIQKIKLGLQWYPDLKLQAAIYVSMFEKAVEGNGYIILVGKNYNDWFFEMFVRAALKVPESVPGVGGMTIVGADLGINTEKIWGAFKAIAIEIGVTYYWGEDSINWGSANDKAQPTYPSLLLNAYDGECEDIPIAYDEENDRVLYAHFGTNFEAPVGAQVLSDDDLVLMGTKGVSSNSGKTNHKFNLGDYDANSNAATMVQLSYPASSLSNARDLAKSFTVKDDTTADLSPLVFYDGDNIDSANANVSWDAGSGNATFVFTVTDPAQFDKDWFISTGTTAADVVLYNVLPLPEVEMVSAPASVTAGSDAAITWTGTGLDELDSVSFFLAESNDPTKDAGYSLGSVTADIDDGSESLTVPADLPTGEYYLRAVYSKTDQLNGVVYSAGKLSVTNPNTPAAVGTPSVSAAGDLKYAVTVPETDDDNTTGYSVTVYDANGGDTGITGLTYDKAASGATTFEVGGSYTGADENGNPTSTYGLTGGASYKIGVTPYKTVDSNGDGEDDKIVYGAEVMTSAIPLPVAVAPTATLTMAGRTLTALKDMAGSSVPPVFTANGLSFTAAFSEAVTGTWTLDDNGLWAKAADDTAVVSGTFDGASASVELSGLADGDHALTLTGSAADGDSFSYSYPFAVDTTAPRLLISAPLNGSVFNGDGSLTISGVTDADALLTVSVDGVTVVSGKTVALAGGKLGADGVFSMSVNIADYNSAARHTVEIFAADAYGNKTEAHSITVAHPGLGAVADVVLMANDAIPSDGNISTAAAGAATLRLMGVAKDGTRFALDSDRVYWSSFTAEGAAAVDGNGVLTYERDASGFVQAMFEVSRGAYRTAVLTFGAASNTNYVSVSATVGGTVTGGGDYAPGDTVTLTATPNSGYRFDHWELTGVTASDLSAATISFVMPANTNVTAKAVFRSVGGSDTPVISGGPGGTPAPAADEKPSAPVTNGTLTLQSHRLEAGERAESCVPCYRDKNGGTVVLPIAVVHDGAMTYLAPEGQEVFFMNNPVSFNDTAGHWAEADMLWAASRGLFNGVGNGSFDPNGKMTRAMFVTVLYRIAGAPEVSGKTAFTDLKAGSWYEDAVIWAVANGIVNGVGDNSFAPDADVTREQMCAFVSRFLKALGYTLELGDAGSFADAGSIAPWAAADVELCQRAGIINGYSDGRFGPKDDATRAQNAAVMHRMIEGILKSLEG